MWAHRDFKQPGTAETQTSILRDNSYLRKIDIFLPKPTNTAPQSPLHTPTSNGLPDLSLSSPPGWVALRGTNADLVLYSLPFWHPSPTPGRAKPLGWGRVLPGEKGAREERGFARECLSGRALGSKLEEEESGGGKGC